MKQNPCKTGVNGENVHILSYTVVGIVKFGQVLPKEIACDDHLHEDDVTKQNKNKNKYICTQKQKNESVPVHKASRCVMIISQRRRSREIFIHT